VFAAGNTKRVCILIATKA